MMKLTPNTMTTTNTEGEEWRKGIDEAHLIHLWEKHASFAEMIKATRKYVAHQRQQAVAEFAREVMALPRYSTVIVREEADGTIVKSYTVAQSDIHTLLEKRNISI